MATPSLVRWLGHARRAPVEGRTVDAQLAALLALDDLVRESDLAGLSPERARARMARSVVSVGLPEPASKVDVHREEGARPGLPIDVYVPRDLAGPRPVLFYVHGGGWVTGDLATHGPFCAWVAARARCCVVNVTYRRAPEARFPSAVDDVRAQFARLPALAEKFSLDLSRLALSGDSAGGNLCAVLARHTRDEAVRPCAQLLIYPATDMTSSMPSHTTYAEGWMLTRPNIDWYRAQYLRGPDDLRDPDASPLFAEDLARVAPAIVYTAGFDPLIDEGRAYAERLRAAGVVARHHCFADMVHGFTLMGGVIDRARAHVDLIADDLSRALEEPASIGA